MKKLIALSLASFSMAAFAAPSANTGCGLGQSVIKDQNTVLMQIFAVTTNGTSGNQTFGISSGTSGCSQPANWVSAETHQFVASNMDALAQDIAQGKGEAVDTLAQLMGVPSANRVAFGATLQSKFASIYSSSDVDATAVLNNIAAVL